MRHLYRYISSSHYSDYSYACEPIDFFSVLRILTMSRVSLNCSCTQLACLKKDIWILRYSPFENIERFGLFALTFYVIE